MTTVESGLTITFTAAGVTGACTWDFGDGSTGTGNPVAHTYAQAGTYSVTATCSVSFSIPVEVATTTGALPGGPILAVITPTLASVIFLAQAPEVPTVTFTTSGLTATFTATGVEDSCTWDFGDGATGSGNPVSHTYADAGSYTTTGTCPVVLALQVSPGEEAGENLAATGYEFVPWLMAALVLAGAGGGLVFATRRARSR
ncbi:MAG: PKD domain-containing protein [Actinomycetota bacterium]|nr:PKD domain-containing protein [Actinomycetota bacterium]